MCVCVYIYVLYYKLVLFDNFDLIYQGLMMTPVFESLALITPTEVMLWVHSEKLTPEVSNHLGDRVTQRDYDDHLFEVRYYCDKH